MAAMRVFAALALPPELAATLGMPIPPDGVRAIPAARWHLTTAFYGEVADAEVDCLTDRLARDVDALATGGLALRIHGGGSFPGGVGYLAVVGADEAAGTRLSVLAETCQQAGRACHAPGTEQRRAYRPHITVFRARRGAAIPNELQVELARTESATWPAEEVQLIASRLGAQPRYDVLQRYPLQV